LTNRHDFDKTESVSAVQLDKRGHSPVTSIFGTLTKRSQPVRRKPRMDAQLNRERILEVAKEAFARSGASTSLDDLAKKAGVGAGTLYRHFLLRAMLFWRQCIGRRLKGLAAAERKLAQDLSRIEALRAWMLLFVDYIATKLIIAPALNTIVGGPSKVYEAFRAQITTAIHGLVDRAIESGDIRRDLDPFDVLRALIGVSNVVSGPDWQQSARRLVDILITGSRQIKIKSTRI
jgi:AcrR family transcriptional regulator